MSSYVSFWVKNQKGQITSLFSYSRSNTIYKAMYDCGIRGDKDYHAEPFTLDKATEARNWLDMRKGEIKKYIREYQSKIEMIKDFKNTTLEEYLNAIEDYQNAIAEWQDELDQVDFTIDIFVIIEEIRESNCDWTATREVKDNVIWAGIDCCMKEEDNEEE